MVGILTNVAKELDTFLVLMGPLGDVVIRLLLLQTLKHDLVLTSDLHEFTLSRLPIQTLLH